MSRSIYLVCKLCRTEWGKGSRMSIPGRQKKKQGDKVRRGCCTIEMLLQMCFICCVLDTGDSYFTVLTLVSFTRAFVALTAVLKEGGADSIYSH